MQPYYENEMVTLFHGDCANLSASFDLLLTDPPYGQEFVSGRSDLWGPIEMDDQPDQVVTRLAHVIKGLKRSRHCYIFGPLDISTLNICGTTELVWDKQVLGMGDLSKPWGPQHEKITFGTYQTSKANRESGYGGLSARLRKGSVLRSIRPHSNRVKNHPTEKPLDILRMMIESSSLIGETVCDPFAGSGSTLVAAAIEGRRAIGCEISEKYCETAARRIEAIPAELLTA